MVRGARLDARRQHAVLASQQSDCDDFASGARFSLCLLRHQTHAPPPVVCHTAVDVTPPPTRLLSAWQPPSRDHTNTEAQLRGSAWSKETDAEEPGCREQRQQTPVTINGGLHIANGHPLGGGQDVDLSPGSRLSGIQLQTNEVAMFPSTTDKVRLLDWRAQHQYTSANITGYRSRPAHLGSLTSLTHTTTRQRRNFCLLANSGRGSSLLGKRLGRV